MDIAELSIGMSQTYLQSAISISVMKMAMNNNTEIATQMTDIVGSNMAVDISKGTNIDVRA